MTITQGQLRGREKNGVRSFLGVPYAEPPFGALRFAAPQPASGWEGVREALEYGPTAPKPGYLPPTDALLPEVFVDGQDCLNLNVWTPEGADGLPVLVWIHGGAFVNGSGAISIYDGSAFARDGVVCVTINYRLGVDGFGLIPGAPPNRGSLDQIAALTWVRDNVAGFGGDPAQVTIAGESAGAMSVATLLALPPANGLFSRAVLQSGAGHHVLTPTTAAEVINEVASRLGVDATVEALGSVPVDDLIRVQADLGAEIAARPDPTRWREITVNGMAFEPVVDGQLLTARPIDLIAAGASRDVEVLVGTNSDEHAFFLVPSGVSSMVDASLLRGALSLLGTDVEQIVGTYATELPGATPGELMIAALSDWFFRIPAMRLAETRSALGADTYVYEFAWDSPRFDGRLGACHALEIAFTFDNLDDPNSIPMAGDHAPQALADGMHRAWVDFVRTGRPGWPAYGADRTVMRFDVESGPVPDPGRPARELWSGVR
ncbi:para-nitrobenzyl esterase [Nakamurella sp. UYEF19]|uniref:carboxylesterase/lipase family protein n=1 Tax=Nakamurella sp. UYEF19 TaxID=1756392 RepID=UPI003392F8DE